MSLDQFAIFRFQQVDLGYPHRMCAPIPRRLLVFRRHGHFAHPQSGGQVTALRPDQRFACSWADRTALTLCDKFGEASTLVLPTKRISA
ncbi:hypothetical protein [Saccharopolyspora shandongensis]|uniref:hypothetical protein n=1 Tax=Saccharopolyspora shandongensis TaxID=418495 RepID=UPI00340D1D9C